MKRLRDGAVHIPGDTHDAAGAWRGSHRAGGRVAMTFFDCIVLAFGLAVLAWGQWPPTI